MKERDLVVFINEKTNNSFEWNPFLEACLCDAVGMKYILNGVPSDPPLRDIAQRFARNAKLLLESGIRGLQFRQIPIEPYLQNREQLISQLDRLIDQCKSS